MYFFLIQLILVIVLGFLFFLIYSFLLLLKLDIFFTLFLSVIFTYLISLIILVMINKIARVLMKIKEGEIKGIDLFLWTIQETSLDIALTLSQKLFIHSPQPDWIYTLFGFKRKKGVSVLTRIWDPDLIEVGENTLIGPQTIISAHHIRRGKLYRKKIIIGRDVVIGAKCLVGPGVIIGDNTSIGYGSSIPPNKILDSYALYAGVPAIKIKDFKSQE